MPKQKSSASSGTRKKHARKAAGNSGDVPEPQQPKGKKDKKDKNAPKIKQYIPPSKPTPVRPDPLDAGGLAARIDPDVLVILRRLGKKDAVTKRRALDELTSLTAGESRDDWSDIAAVWSHHFASLVLHPARRVRQLAATTHAVLLPHITEYIDLAQLLGPWCLLVHDADRAVAMSARPAWEAHGAPAVLRPEGEGDYERETLESYIERAILMPEAMSNEVFPPVPPVVSPAVRRPGMIMSQSSSRAATLSDPREGEEEAASDRNARLRIGGLGALGWLISVSHAKALNRARPECLRAVELWSCLSATAGSAGELQPGVRRATWILLGAVLASGTDTLVDDTELLNTLSIVVLQCAWAELDAGVKLAMWEPLLVFLNKFPRAWILAEAQQITEDDDSDREEEDAEPSQSPTYAAFLQFLSLGCNGSAARGYPTILVILNTIPNDMLGDGSAFFAALWSAVDGRALGTPDAARAFLACVVECALWAVKRGRASLAPEQFSRAWDALLSKDLKGATTAVVADGLEKLARMDDALFQAAWTSIAASVSDKLAPSADTTTDTAHLIAVLQPMTKLPASRALVTQIVTEALARSDYDVLLPLLSSHVFRPIALADATFAAELATATSKQDTDIRLILLYFGSIREPSQRTTIWHRLLNRAAIDPSLLGTLLGSTLNLTSLAPPPEGGLDTAFLQLLDDALSGSSSPAAGILPRVLASPTPYILNDTIEHARETLANLVSLTSDAALRDAAIDLAPVRTALRLAGPAMTRDTNDAWSPLRSKAFLLSRLSSLDPDEPIKLVSDTERTSVLLDLASALLDVSVTATPEAILDSALAAWPEPQTILELLFPTQVDLSRMRSVFIRKPLPAGWAVVDPLALPAPPGFATGATSAAISETDAQGRTPYERVIGALVGLFAGERALARKAIWVLPHLSVLELEASSTITTSNNAASTLLAYLLVAPSDADDNWLVRLAEAVAAHRKPAAGDAPTDLQEVVVEMIHGCVSPREAMGLAIVLRRLLSGAEVKDAEAWTKAARTLERAAPLACHAVLRTLSETRVEPPLLSRLRTELIATLSGVPPSKANAEGLRTLRTLNAAAPDPTGDAALVPQQRAVFVVKAIERWLADDDEDIEPDVECELIELFIHLAPVLQSITGSHWDTILDLIETNLENAELTEPDDLLLMARTLRLLKTILELVASTKMLRLDYWQKREKAIMTIVLRFLQSAVNQDAHESAPLAAVKELLVSLASLIPSSLLDHTTLGQTCHLLASGSPAVLQTVYPFLQQAVTRRTEHLVIEAAAGPVPGIADDADVEGYTVDQDAPVSAGEALAPEIELTLPMELLDLVQVKLDTDLEDNEEDAVLLASWQGQLFSWMLVFDAFSDASTRVRTAFTDQLRDLDIVEEYFVPNVLGLLGVGPSGRKLAKLDVWAVDEFYLSLYEPTSALSAKLLAAHLYFRALAVIPALIRAWFIKSKDRQLTASVSTFTSTIFSPPLIQSTLEPLRSTGSGSDDWTLRLPANSTEIYLSYTVDEQALEIALKLPSDWPLRGVEVREVRKLGGIPEQKWRAWLFGAQVLAGRGEAVEAVGMFKKNVEGHFEGQVECAICYSIISVTDKSMPTKPCRTCKNRFHASCLYKWFKTSHASTCPLCRSDIL